MVCFIKVILKALFCCSFVLTVAWGWTLTILDTENRFTSSSEAVQVAMWLRAPHSQPCWVPRSVNYFRERLHFSSPPKSLLISENIPSQIQVKLCVHKIFGFTESTFSNTVQKKFQASIIFMRTMNTQSGLSTYTHLYESLMIILTDL